MNYVSNSYRRAKSPKPSEHALLEYSHKGKSIQAWITYRRKDGKGEHSGTIATNPEYVKVHHEWQWLPITLPSPATHVEGVK